MSTRATSDIIINNIIKIVNSGMFQGSEHKIVIYHNQLGKKADIVINSQLSDLVSEADRIILRTLRD